MQVSSIFRLTARMHINSVRHSRFVRVGSVVKRDFVGSNIESDSLGPSPGTSVRWNQVKFVIRATASSRR